MVMTLPIQKPGAMMVALSTSDAPSGTRAMRSRASLMSAPKRLLEALDHVRMVVDRHAERLGDAVGGDVVMGRADAAGGEHIIIAAAQRVQRLR